MCFDFIRITLLFRHFIQQTINLTFSQDTFHFKGLEESTQFSMKIEMERKKDSQQQIHN